MGVEQVNDASPEGSRLNPATVGKGRVVGSRGGEMPVFVGGIEARAVSMDLKSATVVMSPDKGLNTYLAMIMVAGGFPMALKTKTEQKQMKERR